MIAAAPPIPLRLLLAAQPKLVTAVLQAAVLHKINTRMMKMRSRREEWAAEHATAAAAPAGPHAFGGFRFG